MFYSSIFEKIDAKAVNPGPGQETHCARQAEDLRAKNGVPGALDSTPSVTVGTLFPSGPGLWRPVRLSRVTVAML